MEGQTIRTAQSHGFVRTGPAGAAAAAAAQAGVGHLDLDVADLTAVAVSAFHDAVVEHDAAADAGAQGHQE